MAKLISLVFFVIFLRGCGGGAGDDVATETAVYSEGAAVEKMDVQNPEDITPKADTLGTMLIKRGNLTFQTANTEKKHAEILVMVQNHQGYISNESSYSTTDRITFNTVVRLPKEHFDPFVNALSKGISHFDHKEIYVEDVTEEFVDIQARLKAKKELEKRYTELLAQAKTVTEMLEIEKQIGELQSDIESIEGRMKYLSQQVSYSTLNLSYYEESAAGNYFGQKFINGFRNGWTNLIWFLVGLVNIWPFILILGVFLYFFTRWIRRRRRK